MGRALHRRPARGARAPRGRFGAESAFSQRSYVANTLAYRRRKGTAAVLEQLARDITGWRCKAVEFFERTASTQHVNHPRPSHQFTVDVRTRSTIRDVRHAVRAGRAPRRGPPYRQRAWPIQRAERRAVHVAPPELLAAGRLGATDRRQALHVRSAGAQRRAVQHAADRALGDAGDRARQRADAVFAASVARCSARLIRGRQHAAQRAGRRCRCRAASERRLPCAISPTTAPSGRMRHRRERLPSTPSWGELRSTRRPRAAP